MATKELLTRIALRYDSYENWTKDQPEGSKVGKNLVLLKGEIGICEIPSDFTANGDSRVMPTVLFKVGNGTSKFHELPWASAKAADVYGWAKSETVVLDGTTIKFKTGDKVNHSIDLSSFATDAEVDGIRAALDARIVAIENSVGSNGDIGKSVADHETRLDVIEGADTVDGSIAKALKDAKAYADGLAGNYDADGAAADALTAAKEYTDTEVKKASDAAADVAANLSAHTSASNPHGITAETIGLENVENKSVADIKTELTGAVADGNDKFVTGDAVYDAIEAAKTAAATTAQDKVDTLASGAVATNASNISKNAGDIEQLGKDLAAEVSRATGVEADHENRLKGVEGFFKTVEGETLDSALDTLKEIQDYLNGEGNATDGIIGRVTALETTLAEGGDFDKRVDAIEADAAEKAASITTLQDLVSDYTGKGAIKTAIQAAHQAGTDAATAAGVADGKAVAAAQAAEAAQGTADAVKAAVENAATGLAKTKEIADGAASEASRLAAIVETGDDANSKLRTDIGALQAIVSTGDDTNAKLRSDITELQGIVKTGADANATLRADLTSLQDVVNHTTTGLAATKKIADDAAAKAADNATRIKAIEDDYLTSVDEFIFNCGTSTQVVHEKTAQ